MRWRFFLALALAAGVAASLGRLAAATPDDFRYKWPYDPTTGVTVTTFPYTGIHGCSSECTDAWDLVIDNRKVLSSAEGTVYEVVSGIPENTCYRSDHLGNHVKIHVGGADLFYGHLVSTALVPGTIYQGDFIGMQGHTGYTLGGTPGLHEPRPPGPDEECGIHLHWEFDDPNNPPDPLHPVHPAEIDGASNPATNPSSLQSSNSTVGNHTAILGNITTGSQAIRDFYRFWGAVWGSAWSVFGWTADWTTNEGGCNPGTYCQLYVHYTPDPVYGHWGLTQTFRIGSGTPAVDDGAIMVGRWTWGGSDPSPDPYWVKPGFFIAWLLAPVRVGLPIAFDVAPPSSYCNSGNHCSAYQRFSEGYIWKNDSGAWQSAVLCADLDNDYLVRASDILAARNAYFHDDPGPQYQPWPESRYDAAGDGFMRIDDITAVVSTYFQKCYP